MAIESSIETAVAESAAPFEEATEGAGSDAVAEDAPSAETAAPAGAGTTSTGLDKDALREQIIAVLKDCYDPEIPVDIWELGLIYEVNVDDDANVEVKMTLTSPACPAAGELPPEVEQRTSGVEGVASARVEVVWEPPWTPDLMSEVARVELNMW